MGNNKFKCILLIFILISPIAIACDCSLISLNNGQVQESYRKAEIVFLGKVKFADDKTTVFSILEVLKGVYRNDSIVTFNNNSCSLITKHDEMWLIYVEKSNVEEGFATNMCLPNRNYGRISPLMEVPSPFIDSLDSFQRHKEILQAIELNSLRQKQILNQTKILEKKNLTISYILWGILILLILRFLSSYIIRK